MPDHTHMTQDTPTLPQRPPARVPVARPATHWSRVRSIGSVAAVTVFLGTAALAPYAMPDAFAFEAQQTPVDNETQLLSATTADVAPLDTSIEAAAPAEQLAIVQKPQAAAAQYSLEEFMFSGVVNSGGYRFTFYSQQVLPGPGLEIPGRHVNAGGYVSDEDGYIVLAGDHPKGTVFETPFGNPGKIYDRGTFGNHLDVYIR